MFGSRLPRCVAAQHRFAWDRSGMSFNADWEQEAANWLAWARTPGHDVYWDYRGAFFELVPPPGSATLEIGCGEGRVARDLAARGHHVTGVDAAPTLLEAAAAAHPEGRYLLADAAQLPFEDASFDLVVAYNSLMDVQDMHGAVREAARVLQPRGRLCVCVTHPLADAGRFAADQEDAPFVIEDSYLESRRFEGRFERKGLEMTFRGWSYSLETYSRALEGAHLCIEALREPPMPEAAADEARWRRVPMFLMLRASLSRQLDQRDPGE
jgi:SAM-dependent methyltransferase